MSAIYNMFEKTAICPLSDIVYTKMYLTDSEVFSYRLDSKEFKNALDIRCSVVNNWSLLDFKTFYDREEVIKIWSCRSVDLLDSYYYTYNETVPLINQFLEFQLEDKVQEFKSNLISILDGTISKLNALVIVSPPSAGKNWYFDGVRDYFLNAGQMHNPNKNNHFAYQDCHNKRIIIWNEPNYESCELENLKMLFAGDCLSANVKCKPQATVKRTPIIILSNSEPSFVRHYAFKDRVLCYYWKAAPFLKDLKKKPYPCTIIDLLYDLIYIVF